MDLGIKTKHETSGWMLRTMGAIFSLLLLIGTSSSAFAADGAKLFKENCATCHKIDKDMTGPKLYEAEKRIPGGRDWIYEWVRNSPKVISSGDEYAKTVYETWNKTQMTPFPSFTNEDIDAILDYIDVTGKDLINGPTGVPTGKPLEEDPGVFSLWNWLRFLILLVVLLLGNIALQIARLRGVELLKGVDLNKMNARLMIGFLVFGMIAALWSSFSFSDMYLYSEGSASEHGMEIDRMFWITMTVVMIVFVLTNILLFYFAYKYRHDENRKARYYPENHKLELIWTVVPAIVLTVLVVFGIKAWTGIMAEPPADAYEVELNAQQFAWNLRYPGVDGEFGDINLHLIDGNNLLGVNFNQKEGQDDFMPNELYLPKGKPVILRIRSRDVLHSVHMPHFRVKMDAVPGMPTRFTLTPKYTTQEWRDKIGNQEFEFELACAEVCGRSHFSMKKIIKVVEEEEYLEWVKSQPPMFDPSIAYKGIDQNAASHTADATQVNESN